MKAARKRAPRADSITAAVQAAQAAAASDIEPPTHIALRDCDLPYWKALVRVRPRENWTDPDLEIAAMLARTKADAVRLHLELDSEADLLTGPTGAPLINPKHRLLEMLERRAISMSRMLQVHPEATIGESRDQAQKAAKLREERTKLAARADGGAKPGLEDLIARGPMQ